MEELTGAHRKTHPDEDFGMGLSLEYVAHSLDAEKARLVREVDKAGGAASCSDRAASEKVEQPGRSKTGQVDSDKNA